MHDDDVRVGQFHSFVLVLDFRIVPPGDFTHEQVHNRRAVEFQSRITRQIVGEDVRASDGGDVENLPRRFGQVVIAHRAIGRAEVHRLREDLFLTSPGANRLVVEPHGGIDLRVFIEPLGIDRIGESGAGAVHEHLSGGSGRQAGQRRAEHGVFGNEVHHDSGLQA